MPGAGLMISGPPRGLLGAFPQAPPPLISSGPSVAPYPWQQAPPTLVGGPAHHPPLLPTTPNIQQGGGEAVSMQEPVTLSSEHPLPTRSMSPETEI